MPKNKWKIARTALTKAPVKTSYNEYIDVETVLEDVLLCKGLDLCTYEADQALAHGHWKKESFTRSGDGTETLAFTLDATHAYTVNRYDVALGHMQYTNATATGTTLTVTDHPVGGNPYVYVIFYKATV